MNNERFLFKNKWVLIVLPVLVALALLIPLKNARINPDLNAYLPESMQSKKNLIRMEEVFGKYEPILVFLETGDVLQEKTLTRIRDLSKELNRTAEFDQVMSLFDATDIKGEDGMMVVEPVVRRIPKTEDGREALREAIRTNDLAYGLVVSEDFRYAMILVNPAKGVSDDDAIAVIQDLLEKYPGDEKVSLNGTPYLKHELQERTTRDLATLLPIGLLAMILFLFFSFREIRGVLLPFSVVVLSILLAMGLMPLFGWELSILAILVPILMIAIANNYGVHIIARYQELNALHPDWSMPQIVGVTVTHLKKPVLFTALTTIVGVLGMAVSVMIPAQQMGIVAALGIGFALFLSITFIPAILVGMKKGPVQPSFLKERNTLIVRILDWVSGAVVSRPRLIVGIFAGVSLVLGLGITRLHVSIRMEEMMPKGHPLRVSTAIADEHFGGTKNLAVLFEGDMKDPALLNRMDRYGRELEGMPEVGRAISLATVMRKMSEAMNDPGTPEYGKIPGTRDAVAQYLELYSMSGDPAEFEKMVDFDYTRGVMNIQFRAEDIASFNRVTDRINSLVKEDPAFVLAGGHSLLEKDLAESVIWSQVYSLLFSVVAIALLLMLIFKAAAGGLMGSLPLIFALICTFGLMGWLGIELDIASAMLSSIAIGVGVDYTIHLFWRLQTELREGKDYPEAIRIALRTTGRGIAINAFSVMLGFSVLFLSGLVLLKTFAFLILFSLLLCLISALVFIPALSLLARPQFLITKKSINHENKDHIRMPRNELVYKRRSERAGRPADRRPVQ